MAGVLAHWASVVQAPEGAHWCDRVSQTRDGETRAQSASALQPDTQDDWALQYCPEAHWVLFEHPGTHTPRLSQVYMAGQETPAAHEVLVTHWWLDGLQYPSWQSWLVVQVTGITGVSTVPASGA